MKIQIVIDALDPVALGHFWAAALGYEVEDSTEFIGGLLEQGIIAEEEVREYEGKRYFRTLVAISDPSGIGSRVLLQLNDQQKSAKNRLHLDLTVGPDNRQSEVQRLQGIGATVLYEVDDAAGRHTTMSDPEGNEFCVQ